MALTLTPKQKVTICAFGASILGFLGTISTGLCAGLPPQYQGVCILAGKGASSGAEAVEKHINCQPSECVNDVHGAIIQRGQSENYCVCP